MVGWTPLHYSAANGHLEVCRLFMDTVEDKNPEDLCDRTPLHLAAKSEHLEVCHLFLDTLEDKNPADEYGWTLLHVTAQNGQLEVCRFIMNTLENKNPASSRCQWLHTSALCSKEQRYATLSATTFKTKAL